VQVKASLLGLLCAGLILAGCGGEGGVTGPGDLANGKAMFTSAGCAGCHTLAAAGASGTAGPNLDDAFGPAREQGFDESTFIQVVREQIRIPALGSAMPANLVTGKNADDVAYFVAHCAGNAENQDCAGGGGGGGGEISATDGKDIFAQAGCASCHTLAAAGASGTVGPNLDQAKPPKDLVVDRVTNGKGGMPPFKDKLTPEQIQAVADFVSQNAGQ
jgi:mono/diheme cytochrome c family protein